MAATTGTPTPTPTPIPMLRFFFEEESLSVCAFVPECVGREMPLLLLLFVAEFFEDVEVEGEDEESDDEPELDVADIV